MRPTPRQHLQHRKGSTMAKVLKKFDFTPRGPQAIYPWSEWLNGKLWQLTEGEDYTCKTQTLVTMAKNQVGSKGQELKFQKVEGGVVIQCEGEPDEENGKAFKAAAAQYQKDRKARQKAKLAEGNGEETGEEE